MNGTADDVSDNNTPPLRCWALLLLREAQHCPSVLRSIKILNALPKVAS